MMVTIHGLPTNTKYQYLREIIKQECNISDFILDNLLPEGNGFKKVRVGLTNDFEGNHVIKCLNGYCFSGHILQVTAVGNSGNFQSQQHNVFPVVQSSVVPWNNQLQWNSVLQQQHNQDSYRQMNNYAPSAINQPSMNQYHQRTSVFDRIGPPAQDFSMNQNNASQQIVAPTMAPEQEQLQWSANVRTYQNNIPFYQQQISKSQNASTFELDACASGGQSRGGDVPRQNISYPDKTTQAESFVKRSQYKWVQGCNIPDSRHRHKEVRGDNRHRDGQSKVKINRQEPNRNAIEDRNRNTDRSSHRKQDGDHDRYGNRNRGGNRDRDSNRDHKEKRDRERNRDRDGNRDHDAIHDRFKFRDKNPKPDARPAFSCHDSARHRKQIQPPQTDTGNLRESRWDTHVRNQRELDYTYEPLKVTVKNEQFQNSTQQYSYQNSSSIQQEFSDNHQIDRPSNEIINFNSSSHPALGKFGDKSDQLNNISRKNNPIHDPYEVKNQKRKYVQDTKPFNQDRNEKNPSVRPSTQAPPNKKFKQTVSKVVQNGTVGAQESLSKRLNRHTTWVQQVSSGVAKSVLESVGKSPTDNRLVFVELKKCIQNRINMIFGNNLSNTMDEIITEYNKEFKADQNYELYKTIQEIVVKKTNMNKPVNVLESASTAEPQRQDMSPNTTGSASTSQQTPISVHQVTRNGKAPPVSAGGSVTVLPKIPTRVAADIKLPKYPLGDKSIYKQQKQATKLGVLLDLSEPYKSILKEHIKEIEIVATECCREVDSELGASNFNYWQGAVQEMKKILRMHVTNRILNVRNGLILRIFYNPTKPKLELLEAFLKKYDVISMKKSDRKKMIVIQCGTYKGYDNLCKLRTTILDNVTITMKPLHLTGNPKKGIKKAEMVIEQSDSESDDTEKLISDIDKCQRDILNDSDVVLLENNEEVIDLDKIEDNDDERNTQNADIIDENIESSKIGNGESIPSSVESAKIDNSSDIGNKCEQLVDNVTKNEGSNDFANTAFIKDNLTINNNQNSEIGAKPNQDAETKEDMNKVNERHDSPSLIVGDHSYVVLDCVDDENASDCNITNTEDAIADEINEDDLEDF